MDHRSWPWKKKSSGKSLAILSSADPSRAHSARLNHEPDLQRVLAEHAMNSFEPTRQWHQTEEKVRDLNLKLTAAISDCKAKDELVKQHAKVAEEAVSGWEKAKAEAVGLEKQLDVAIQEKISFDRRVAHLDGALKECMRDLRRVRTEQEDKIDEAMVKRTREWEKVRTEFEAKLSELSHQLLEERAEKNSVLKSLQECRRRLSELEDTKSTAETQVKVLQVRVQTIQKENSALKFDLHVLNKEIAIRNDEREKTRKGADAANKQHLERAKKIAKLEAECQTLKVLARKSAVQAHKKLETDALAKESSERKKKVYPVKKGGHLRRPTPNGAAESKSQCGSNESNVFSEKSSAMEDEIRVLRENLLRKEKELQSSKLICANTSSRLSHVEGQLETMKSVPKSSLNNPAVHGDAPTILGLEEVSTVVSMSEDSCNGDQLSSADAWASALIAELAVKEKSVSINVSGSLVSTKRDLMDDFAEMERLASAVPSTQKPKHVQIKSDTTEICKNDMRSYNCIGGMHDQTDSLEDRLLSRERELQDARQYCSDLNRKLSLAEEKLAALHSKNSANEEVLIHLQGKLDTMLEEQYESNIFDKDLKIQGGVEPSPGITAKKAAKSAICKIIQIVGTLAQETGGAPGFSPPNHSPRKARNDTMSDTAIDHIIIDGELILGLHSDNVELDLQIHKLVCLSNNLLQGAVDVFSFISELAIILEFVTGVGVVCRRFSNVLCHNNTKQAGADWSQRFTLSESGYKVDELEEETKNMLTPLQSAQNSASVNGEVQAPTINTKLQYEDGEFSESGTNWKTFAERSRKLLEDQLAAMVSLNEESESEIHRKTEEVRQLQERLKLVESEVHEACKQRLDAVADGNYLQKRLVDTEELMSTLPMQLESAQRTIRSAEDQIEAMVLSKSVLESHAKATEAQVNQLQQKITQFHTQNVDHLNTLMECQNLQQQFSDVKKQNLDLSSQLTFVTEAQQFLEDKLAKYVESIASLESDIKAAEVGKNQLQEKLVKLQSELQFEHERHEEDVMELQNLQQQLSQGEQSVIELQLQLASTQNSNKIVEAKLADMATSNKALQSQVKVADTEVKELQERLAALHWGITEERTYHDDEFTSFQNHLHHVSISRAWISSVEVDMPSKLCIEETGIKREQEIAAATGRLADCQRTIGLLGKQLRALSLTNCFQENGHIPITTNLQGPNSEVLWSSN